MEHLTGHNFPKQTEVSLDKHPSETGEGTPQRGGGGVRVWGGWGGGGGGGGVGGGLTCLTMPCAIMVLTPIPALPAPRTTMRC